MVVQLCYYQLDEYVKLLDFDVDLLDNYVDL